MANAHLGTVLRQLRRMVSAKAYEDTSDGELLERFRTGREEAAFVALLRRHGPMVLHVCRRVQGNEHDAEDTFQATFLLLARKAGAIRKQESVASWLHGVAHRLALEAKGQGARRQARERRVAEMGKASAVSDKAWQDLQATLDEALRQVPEKYRAPLLLCYLEGKTQEEAARHLGCPLGTLRSRLARGRNRLKAVLERQGVRLSATALAAALAATTASAAVAFPLLQRTGRAALEYAGGKAATALVSARAAALLEGGLKAMAAGKLKIATAVVLAAGTFGLGAAAVATHVLAGPSAATAEARSPAAPGLKGRPDASASPEGMSKEPAAASPARAGKGDQHGIAIRGRVLDVNGKPLAGATLLLLGQADKLADLGTSAADGRFTVRVPKGPKAYYLVARVAGAGIDFIDLGRRNPTGQVELRMVPDRLIRGRILDTQGKPVAGAGVAVTWVGVYAGNSLDTFLAEWKQRNFMNGVPDGVKSLWRDGSSFLAATTDAAGRFAVAGTGAERLVSLRIHRAGIADDEVWVVNRHGFDPTPYNQATRDNIPKGFEHFAFRLLLHGSDVSLVAEAEKPIRGVVKEADTGKGRPGVEVCLTRAGDDLLMVSLKTQTDAHGRYTLRGARKAKSYMVEVWSDPAAGYMPCQVWAADTAGYQPVTADIRVAKGVAVTGRVIDKSTGKSIPGIARVGVLSDNPFVKAYPEFSSSAWMRTEDLVTAADGTFRVVTIPGPVLLMGGPDYRRLPGGLTEAMKYKPPVPDPMYPQYFPKGRPTEYYGAGAISPLQGNFCKVLQIKPGAAVVKQDIILEQASALLVKIQDAGGRPLSSAWVTGISPQNWTRPIRIEKDSCPAYGVDAGKRRVMVFYEPGKKLFGTLKLKADAKAPAVANLGPGGVVKGRLLAENGKPLSGVVVEVSYREREAQEIHDYVHRAKWTVTDANGAFRIDELIPGLPFDLYHHRSKRPSPNGKKVLNKTVTVRPAAPLDLGDIKLKAAPQDDGE